MDGYARTTRLYPAIAVMLPITLSVVLCFQLNHVVTSVVACFAAAGFHLVVMRLVRDRGARAQTALWRQWGGNPAVQQLRWTGASDVNEVAALHRRVVAASNLPLPDARTEITNPAAADRAYDAAVARLREKTRDRSRFPRIHAELTNYGIARNLYSVRKLGLGVAAVTVLAAGALGYLNLRGITEIEPWSLTASGVAAVIIGVMWLLIITRNYVRRDADRYASALLAAADEGL